MKRKNYLALAILWMMLVVASIVKADTDEAIIHKIEATNDVVFVVKDNIVVPPKFTLKIVAQRVMVEQMSKRCKHVYVVEYPNRLFSVIGFDSEVEHRETTGQFRKTVPYKVK